MHDSWTVGSKPASPKAGGLVEHGGDAHGGVEVAVNVVAGFIQGCCRVGATEQETDANEGSWVADGSCDVLLLPNTVEN